MGKIRKQGEERKTANSSRKKKKRMFRSREQRENEGKFSGIKWKFTVYVILGAVISFAGSFVIGVTVNHLQDWYLDSHRAFLMPDIYNSYHIWYQLKQIQEDDRGGKDQDADGGNLYVEPQVIAGRRFRPEGKKYEVVFWFITNSQVVLIPLWIFFCVAVAGKLFYKCELKRPIDLLLTASKKIADNELDFEIYYKNPNEMGMLCRAFDEMRKTLYENNREMWRSLEERKRLNSAFSHDLRTPLTVLRGYTDFLAKYIPGGRISEEKLLGVLGMMDGQITRLEHYTRKMSSVQKLEDITPAPRRVAISELWENLLETGKFICAEKRFVLDWEAVPDKPQTEDESIFVDTEILFQVYENLVSNASRYAKHNVHVLCRADDRGIELMVSDDGDGFSRDALAKAAEPFYRDEKEPDKTHFGLGLYICRILCEKCGGELAVGNGAEDGGRVIARLGSPVVTVPPSPIRFP